MCIRDRGSLDRYRDRVVLNRADGVAADRDVEHADVVVVLVRERPGDARDHRGSASLANVVEHLDADDVGGGGDATELHRREAAVLARNRSGTVASDEPG